MNAVCAPRSAPTAAPLTRCAATTWSEPTGPSRSAGRDGEAGPVLRCPGRPALCVWRAGPWAGKSALVVVRAAPPPEMAGRVRIVSFFITARLAAQDTREAYTQVLLEQLASLLDQSLRHAA